MLLKEREAFAAEDPLELGGRAMWTPPAQLGMVTDVALGLAWFGSGLSGFLGFSMLDVARGMSALCTLSVAKAQLS